jgi:hypothetical protein
MGRRGVAASRTDGRPREGSSSMTSFSGCPTTPPTKSTGVLGTDGLGERDVDSPCSLCARRPRDSMGEVENADS